MKIENETIDHKNIILKNIDTRDIHIKLKMNNLLNNLNQLKTIKLDNVHAINSTFKQLETTKIRELELKNSPLNIDVINSICHMIENNCRLKHLSLVNCQLDTNFLQKLSQSLIKNQTLFYLNLSNNFFNLNDSEYKDQPNFKTYLCKTTSLRCLIINSNRSSNYVGKIIDNRNFWKDILTQNESLCCLSIVNESSIDSYIKTLLSHLKFHKHLTHFKCDRKFDQHPLHQKNSLVFYVDKPLNIRNITMQERNNNIFKYALSKEIRFDDFEHFQSINRTIMVNKTSRISDNFEMDRDYAFCSLIQLVVERCSSKLIMRLFDAGKLNSFDEEDSDGISLKQYASHYKRDQLLKFIKKRQVNCNQTKVTKKNKMKRQTKSFKTNAKVIKKKPLHFPMDCLGETLKFISTDPNDKKFEIVFSNVCDDWKEKIESLKK